MTVPDRFIGAWRRTELIIDGSLVGPEEDADVLWLQGSTWYADLRIPVVDGGGAIEAFAGPARWDEPWFAWDHHLDWLGTFPSDEGTFEADGDAMVERGSFDEGGRSVPYRERWVRAAPDTGFVVARLDRADARVALVQVGPHRLVLVDDRTDGGRGGFAARRDERIDGVWRTTFARGPGIEDLAPPTDPETSVVGDVITFGAWTSTVTETGAAAPTDQPRPT